jgi:hypothetical protein
MTAEPAGILAAELRWREAPDLASEAFSADRLLPRVRELAGTRVELVDREPGGGTELFAFPEVVTRFDGGDSPMLVMWALPDALATVADLPADAFLYSADWPEAQATLSGASQAMIVTDLMGRLVDPGHRLRAWHAVLRAIVEASRPAGLHIPGSQRVISPDAYLALLDADPTGLGVMLNLRRFLIDPDTAESVFDTVGLAALGLPDVQLHFRGLDRDEAARWVWNVAWYLFEHGDVIADGHTIAGVDPSERWPCRHEIGLADPEREVLDADPSPHGPERPA